MGDNVGDYLVLMTLGVIAMLMMVKVVRPTSNQALSTARWYLAGCVVVGLLFGGVTYINRHTLIGRDMVIMPFVSGWFLFQPYIFQYFDWMDKNFPAEHFIDSKERSEGGGLHLSWLDAWSSASVLIKSVGGICVYILAALGSYVVIYPLIPVLAHILAIASLVLCGEHIRNISNLKPQRPPSQEPMHGTAREPLVSELDKKGFLK